MHRDRSRVTELEDKKMEQNKNTVKKGAWSEEEDDKLRAYILRYGHWNWGLLPKFAGLSRSGKSCRLRWMNYLRPNIKHGNFTKEEDDMIVDLHNKLGNKWSAIAANLPGRSDNEIKNRWHTHLKKQVPDDEETMLESRYDKTIDSDQANPKENPHLQLQKDGEILMAGVASELPSCSSSTEISPCLLGGSECTVSRDVATQTLNYETAGDFWTEPFLSDITSSANNTFSSIDSVDNFVSQSFCQDLMMSDEFSWSMWSNSYIESSYEFMNWS